MALPVPDVCLKTSTGKELLLARLTKAFLAVRAAENALEATEPDPRDYRDNKTFAKAYDQHHARLAPFISILSELNQIAVAVSNQSVAEVPESPVPKPRRFRYVAMRLVMDTIVSAGILAAWYGGYISGQVAIAIWLAYEGVGFLRGFVRGSGAATGRRAN